MSLPRSTIRRAVMRMQLLSIRKRHAMWEGWHDRMWFSTDRAELIARAVAWPVRRAVDTVTAPLIHPNTPWNLSKNPANEPVEL
jgi:hypothetical protein